LAEASGVSVKAIGAIERGQATPRLQTIRRIVAVLDVDALSIVEFAAALDLPADGDGDGTDDAGSDT